MKKQTQTTSYFKKIILAITVTFCWVTAASANLITYDLTIRYYDDQIDTVYTGVAELDTDTHVMFPGSGGEGSDITHNYSLSYEIESTDGQFSYSGGGYLFLSEYEDAYVHLDGFATYLNEEAALAFDFDPQPEGWVWHDPDFDVMSIRYMTFPQSSTYPNSFIQMEQVSRVPEPSVLLLMAAGLIGLGFAPRKTLKA